MVLMLGIAVPDRSSYPGGTYMVKSSGVIFPAAISEIYLHGFIINSIVFNMISFTVDTADSGI